MLKQFLIIIFLSALSAAGSRGKAISNLYTNEGYKLGWADEFNPFSQPHFILVNLAIGGQIGRDPSPSIFPKKFEFDDVRSIKNNKVECMVRYLEKLIN